MDIETIIKIENDMRYKPDTFTGTEDEWAAVPTAQRAHYKIVNITDDLEAGKTTLNISTELTRLYGATVTITDGEETIIKTLSSSGAVTAELHNVGVYTITCDIYTDSVNVARMGITIAHVIEPNIVSWSTGTNTEISTLINAAYLNDIDLYDDCGWRVGDERTVSLAAMEATGVGESHHQQSTQMVILDFEHDDLITPINGHTKALITVQQKCGLASADAINNGYVFNNSSDAIENGYMNSTETISGGWGNTNRRTWCNNVYYNALPDYFKLLVKETSHKYTAGRTTTLSTSNDKVFILSIYEYFGNRAGHGIENAIDGTQYEYYKSSDNILKLPRSSTNNGGQHWTRSITEYNGNYFVILYVNGGGNSALANNTGVSIAPAMCL